MEIITLAETNMTLKVSLITCGAVHLNSTNVDPDLDLSDLVNDC